MEKNEVSNKEINNIPANSANNQVIERDNYMALNNHNDNEMRRIQFVENETKWNDNLLEYFNFNDDQIKNLKIKIFSNGKRILIKEAFILWLVYFLIISNSLLFFIFM